jgi:lipopolysaccharide transport system ATP-binding protein
MARYAIQAHGLSKAYRISTNRGASQYRTLRETLGEAAQRPFRRRSERSEILWALDDVSFEVRQGEAIGFIGRNGAGKSTLLKLMSRITRPTRGTADVYGRVGSLLEVGTGFHPELSGRENIYLNGAILGMSRAYVRRRFDEIVDFAEIEKFLDTPVKRYSSGMYMRLAFAVAAHLEPEILIVDEVLAVGDAAFQAKSLGKMGDAARSGRTVLFVSHNMAAIAQLCETAILLERGRIKAVGRASSVIGDYLASGNRDGQVRLDAERKGPYPPVRFTRAELLDVAGRVCQDFPLGANITLVFGLAFTDPSIPTKLAVSIRTVDGLQITHTVDDDASFTLPTGATEQSVRVVFPDIRLYPGTYRISLVAVDAQNTVVFDEAKDCLTFTITDGGRYTHRWLPRSTGIIYVTPEWSVVPDTGNRPSSRRQT